MEFFEIKFDESFVAGYNSFNDTTSAPINPNLPTGVKKDNGDNTTPQQIYTDLLKNRPKKPTGGGTAQVNPNLTKRK